MPEKVDYLYGKGIPAVWFCQGDYLEQRPDFALQAIRKGFLLGNHSFDHPHFSNLEQSECFEQIERTDRIIEKLYQKVRIRNHPKYFRFPYGDKGEESASGAFPSDRAKARSKKESLQEFLKNMGYLAAPSTGITYKYYRDLKLDKDIDWYWTYDVMDWSINAAEPQSGIDSIDMVLARMDENDPERGKGLNSGNSVEIVLLHDHEDTSTHFKRILERLTEKELSFELPLT
jgi:peptidoglycan-N-acetylglucosamine deacetylase